MSQTNICEITSAGLFIGVLQLPSNQIVTNAPTIPENHQARWNGKSWEYIAAVKNVCQLDKLNCFIGITTADLDLLEPETTYLLPAGCIDAEPPTVKDGFVAMWESGKWNHVKDHRGQSVYDTNTGLEHIIDELGEIPAQYTLMPRPDKYHVWIDGLWSMTVESEQQKQTDVESEKLRQMPTLLLEAAQRISEYQDMFDFAETDAESEAAEANLTAWRQYRAALLKYQKGLSTAFPNKPEQY